MNSKEKQSLVDLLFETCDVLHEVSKSEIDLPYNWRYPLEDELYGFAFMLRDEIK